MHKNISAQDSAQTNTSAEVGAQTNPQPYTYREMTPSDNAAVASLVRTNLKEHKLDIPGTVYYDDGLDHLSDYYCDEEHKYYVLTDESGAVLGGVGFARFDPMPNTAELQKLYLHNSVKRRGFGYDLMTLVEDKMREAGFQTSYLETHDNLEAAIHLYEKCDYNEIPRPDFVKHSAMTRFFTKAL